MLIADGSLERGHTINQFQVKNGLFVAVLAGALYFFQNVIDSCRFVYRT
jgi:hypothetical protein